MKSILVRSPNWIGDQILAFPFFYYLRQVYPRAFIASVCNSSVESLQYRNLVDQVIPLETPPPGTDFWTRFLVMNRAAAGIKRMREWDLGISLPNSFSAAWLLHRAGCGERRGFTSDGRGFLLNQKVPASHDGVEHRTDSYLRLLPKTGLNYVSAMEFWGIPAENDLDPNLPGVLKGFDAKRAWSTVEPLTLPRDKHYWVLAPGSNAESRRWPLDRFARLAKRIRERTRWKGIIVGGPNEAPLASRLTEDTSLGLEDWTGQGPVASYWRIFQDAQLTVSNDSGLAHMASLCGSPVHIAWGAGDPRRTKPLGPGYVQYSFNPVDCWPCERNRCARVNGQMNECLRGVSPEEIWKDIESGIR